MWWSTESIHQTTRTQRIRTIVTRPSTCTPSGSSPPPSSYSPSSFYASAASAWPQYSLRIPRFEFSNRGTSTVWRDSLCEWPLRLHAFEVILESRWRAADRISFQIRITRERLSGKFEQKANRSGFWRAWSVSKLSERSIWSRSIANPSSGLENRKKIMVFKANLK